MWEGGRGCRRERGSVNVGGRGCRRERGSVNVGGRGCGREGECEYEEVSHCRSSRDGPGSYECCTPAEHVCM